MRSILMEFRYFNSYSNLKHILIYLVYHKF